MCTEDIKIAVLSYSHKWWVSDQAWWVCPTCCIWSVCKLAVALQVPLYFSHPFMWDDILVFEWFKRGKLSWIFRCWKSKETADPVCTKEQGFFAYSFTGLLVRVWSISRGQRHEVWGKIKWQWCISSLVSKTYR